MLTSLFTTHYRELVRLAELMVDDRDLAEDVVQDAFVALDRRWWSIRDHDRALFYLRAAVANGARDRLRHRRVVRDHDANLMATPAPPAEAVALDHVDRQRIGEQLAKLPTRQRQVLVLRYYEDYSEAQIADCLGISRGAVKAHASRAVAALAVALEVKR